MNNVFVNLEYNCLGITSEIIVNVNLISILDKETRAIVVGDVSYRLTKESWDKLMGIVGPIM